jgi:hypothetical protein
VSQRFPIDNLDPAIRAAREGMPWAQTAFYNATPANTNPAIITMSGAFPRATNYGVGGTNTANYEYSFYGTAEGDERVNEPWWQGRYPQLVAANEDGATPLKCRMSLSGRRIADDSLWDAAKTILFAGDSILGTGPPAGSARSSLAHFQVLNYLRAAGKDYRVAVKQLGGTTTSHGEAWRDEGLLDVPGVDVVAYQWGANDCANSVSSVTYSANWSAFVNWALLRWPTCHVLMLGPSPAENNTTDTNAAAYRTALSGYVSGLGNSRVKYLNLGTAFTRTDTSNYATTDTTGSHIHPNVQGNAAIYTNCWLPFLSANLDWF